MEPQRPEVDIAIITVIPAEYAAVLFHIEDPERDPGSSKTPNQYAWQLGALPRGTQGSHYRVVLGLAGRPTNTSAALATMATIRRWRPRYTLLVGIAGGLPREGLNKGDVVVSTVIWAYEYGKQVSEFHPRHDFTYRVDGSLLRAAATVSDEWKHAVRVEPPEQGHVPKAIHGPMASGDKVVDDVSNDFFKAVLDAWPKIQAVEMEGAGAAAAIGEAHDLGLPVGFIMIRGISDMPILTDADAAVVKQTQERDAWTNYAAASAASFTAHLIRTAWPVPPLDESPR